MARPERSSSLAERISLYSAAPFAPLASASMRRSTGDSSSESIFPARASLAHLFRSRAATRRASPAARTAFRISPTP